MTDFTAARLERLAASAYDLVANAFLGEPSASGFQGQKLEPICTEPYCGGLYWHEGASWKPQEAPPLLDPGPLGAIGEAHDPASDMDAAPPKPKKPLERMQDYLFTKPLDKLDMTGAQVYLPLDKPIAEKVKMTAATHDEWPWWMAQEAKKITIGAPDSTGKTNYVKAMEERIDVMNKLDPFLRVKGGQINIDGKMIDYGEQLQTVTSGRDHKHLRVGPWMGSKEQLASDAFPIELTFGKPKNIDRGEYSKVGETAAGWFRGRQGPPKEDYKKGIMSGPPDQRPVEGEQILNVKRLDVVLKKPRQDFKDFLPPLMTTHEPENGLEPAAAEESVA